MQLVVQTAGASALIALVAAVLLLTWRSSGLVRLSLVVSLAALVAAHMWGDVAAQMVYPPTQNAVVPSTDKQGGNAASALLGMESWWLAAQLAELLRVLTLLWFALSLLVGVARVGPPAAPPNNSSKPTPLRGAA